MGKLVSIEWDADHDVYVIHDTEKQRMVLTISGLEGLQDEINRIMQELEA
jgi:hypothetical protein